MYPTVCSLTGLPNRMAIERRLTAPSECPRWIGLANLDSFRWFNHVFTHAAGDELLVSVARIATEVASARDVLAFRLQSDNFIFLTRECSAAHMRELLLELQHRVLSLAVLQATEAKSTVGLVTVSVAQLALPGCPILHPHSVLDSLEQKLASQRALGPRFAVAALSVDG